MIVFLTQIGLANSCNYRMSSFGDELSQSTTGGAMGVSDAVNYCCSSLSGANLSKHKLRQLYWAIWCIDI